MIRAAALLALLASPASAHSWYTGITNAEGQGCCGLADCAPIPTDAPVRCTATECEIDMPAGAHPTADRAGTYLFRGVPGSSPDENTHFCFVPNGPEQRDRPEGYAGVIRCMWFGGGM